MIFVKRHDMLVTRTSFTKALLSSEGKEYFIGQEGFEGDWLHPAMFSASRLQAIKTMLVQRCDVK